MENESTTDSIDETFNELVLVHLRNIGIIVDQPCDSPETEELSFSNSKEILLCRVVDEVVIR